jgi:hypothetical protein
LRISGFRRFGIRSNCPELLRPITLAGGAAGLDERGQAGDFDRVGDFESRPEIVPEFDALFFAGFEQAEKCVSAVAAAITSSSSADLALRHVVADGVFRSVVMERNFRTVEDDEQLGLVGEQAL